MAEKPCPKCGRPAVYDEAAPPDKLHCRSCGRVWRLPRKNRKESEFAIPLPSKTQEVEEPKEDGIFDRPLEAKLNKVTRETEELAAVLGRDFTPPSVVEERARRRAETEVGSRQWWAVAVATILLYGAVPVACLLIEPNAAVVGVIFLVLGGILVLVVALKLRNYYRGGP